jgi:Gpi18-like mannosyltransferase
MADQSPKYSRRTVALFWLFIFSVVIGALLYFEQIAVLYVLATLSLVALLLVVAFADLEHVGIEGGDNFSSGAE